MVKRVMVDILQGYTKETPDGDDEKKTGGNYLIFVVTLFLEDLGQILCQGLLCNFKIVIYSELSLLKGPKRAEITDICRKRPDKKCPLF